MNVAIIAAAGQGTRISAKRAKQFLELGGTPIIVHTLRRFDACAEIDEVVVCLQPEESGEFLKLVDRFSLRKVSKIIPGGATRVETVWRGLQAVRSATAEIVAVHDGVRPFVTSQEIGRVVNVAKQHGAAILAAPAIDTIKEVSNGIVARTLVRANLRHALTPQCFRYAFLKRAFEECPSTGSEITDESALVERLGVPVVVVEGDARNIKITRPLDLALGEILLKDFPAEAESKLVG